MSRRLWQRGLWLALLPLVTACGSTLRTASPEVSPPVVADLIEQFPGQERPSADPVLALIAQSDVHFREGQQELTSGHVEGARLAFNKAVSILIESEYGGRTEPRIREHFERLVDRISAYELRALAEGDGFTETGYEPASIDELLAASASLTPPTGSGLEAAESDSVIHDIPIVLNARVLSFIELFQGRLHDFIAEGMRRGSQYLPMIQSVFRAEGLPLDLAYIPLVESAFKPNALSRARARGVWQFVSTTGIQHGLRQDWYVDERSDPAKATVAAAKYLTTLSKMFNGDWYLALASYNGGPGRVQRAIRRSGGLRDFWKLAGRSGLLPRETRDYVPMILAAIVIARNPAQYGFDIEPMRPLTYETVTLSGPVDLRRIAEWTDTTVDEVQSLNPELRRWTTPVRDPEYAVKVPVGTADLLNMRLAETSNVDLVSLRWHTVKAGETLTTIARNLRVNRADLADANYLKVNSRIAAGEKLIVPHEPVVLMAGRVDGLVPPVASAAGDADRPTAATSRPELEKVIYRVKRGDTLGSIARLFRTSVASLQEWNRIRGTKILANQSLVIYRTTRGN
jgi:membrane-bound lytic murein transglycosylase D